MVSEEDFGAFIAEFEGFRDSILDLIVELRKDVEKLRDEMEDIKEAQKGVHHASQRRLS